MEDRATKRDLKLRVRAGSSASLIMLITASAAAFPTSLRGRETVEGRQGSIDVEWQADSTSGKLKHSHVCVHAVQQHTAFACGAQPCSNHSSQSSGTQVHNAQPSVRVILLPECVPDVASHCASSSTSISTGNEGIAPAHTVVAATQWVGNRLVKEGSRDLGTFAPGNYCFF